MKDPINLQDWDLLSDSETNSISLEEIIHSDYFALDSSNLHPKDEVQFPPTNELEKNLMNSHPQTEKGGSFLADGANVQMGFQGIELGRGEINKGGSFPVDDSKMEVGIEGIAKGDSFGADGAEMELGSEGTDPRHQNSDVVDSKDELGIQEIKKGDSSLADGSKMEVGIEEIDSISQNSDGAGDLKEVSSAVGDGEKKVFAWWKLPLDILKLCASRVRLVWSIPIVAAVFGILMVGRRLYKMKHKNRRISLKVTFDDKKATSKLLVRAACLNEIVVRRVPIVRSPLLLPASGVTPWPVVGLLRVQEL